ncbi:TetR/AcrR family transcriptional regulator [Actinoplanes sp. N902-109]|uniref:TetR/AcrR family transcriptional regulator n=1 Tax=Actinoplanes sp. (strain N902-109) TaxID=649831 RepID=UPI000329620E|nr:TetR/AcrR family transcriptional regulator [Actinoplanes sp. N902-109]AGL19041.1 TetR family transcriptional regulator [Actinoplanes sp. N902-109]
MARWQPDAHARLEEAALELFAERGYEAVSAAEIAVRAGLTKATFFRHFPDKPEVLFWGQDLLATTFRQAIADGAPDASPLELVRAAVLAVGPIFDADRHRHAATRQRLITSSPALHERAVLKRAVLAQTMTEALQARGVAAGAAELAGLAGTAAFGAAYVRWAAGPTYRAFTTVARRELDRIVDAAASLS